MAWAGDADKRTVQRTVYNGLQELSSIFFTVKSYEQCSGTVQVYLYAVGLPQPPHPHSPQYNSVVYRSWRAFFKTNERSVMYKYCTVRSSSCVKLSAHTHTIVGGGTVHASRSRGIAGKR